VIEISRIEHISMAVPDAEPAIRLFRDLMGFHTRARFEDERLGYTGLTLPIPGPGNVDWEVISPIRDGSYLDGFLRSGRGPGLHHVCCQVPSLPRAIEQLRALGIEPFGLPDPASDRQPDEVFIHPRDGHGVLFQLVESTSSDHAATAEPPPGPTTTLGIAAIDHVAHATTDRDGLAAWYGRVFGMRTVRRTTIGGRAFETTLLETPTGQLQWELIEPSGEASFVGRFIEQRGPALHHVTFRVQDWERALAACAQHGVRSFGAAAGGDNDARWREAFLHPRDTGGVLIQFYWEERPGAW